MSVCGAVGVYVIYTCGHYIASFHNTGVYSLYDWIAIRVIGVTNIGAYIALYMYKVHGGIDLGLYAYVVMEGMVTN